jgi:aspartyl-tRNA synthetase
MVGKSLHLFGWIQTRRDHGGLIFLDLRDRSGLLQCVVKDGEPTFKTAEELRGEYVVEVEGVVTARPEKLINPDLSTGSVELKVSNITILSPSETPPFEIDGAVSPNEEIRLSHRYLDLRTSRMRHNLGLRHQMTTYIRNFLDKRDFYEVETPYLTKGTPEGAREFIVPSRLTPGSFYTLPQAPQQFKQLLMVGGIERYFQIARCFRDEDPRGDRQPEFTQLDLEMSFVEQEDILQLVEELAIGLTKELLPEKKIVSEPFPRLKYADVMQKYGTDRPDLRSNKNDPNELAFAFITDFPMFEPGQKPDEWTFSHNPFSMPTISDPAELKASPGKARAYQYDLVLNGEEIAGGSIRNHYPELLRAVLEILGHSKQDIQGKFGHMLEAFRYGVPPHGGIAFGFDRWVMVMAGEPNIREVIAFPKTGDMRDLMMGAPSPLPDKLLSELKIEVRKPKSEHK